MRLGEDFDKIEFQAFGMDLLEPNAFIGDTIIAIASFFFAFSIYQFKREEPFFKYWKLFFIVFGLSFLTGGLGHLFFNQWDIPGKYPSWFLSLFAPFFIERAMLSLMENKQLSKTLSLVSTIKLVLATLGTIAVIYLVDLTPDPSVGIRVVTIHSTIGLVFALGYLGFKYSKKIAESFKYFWISVIIMIPSVFIQALKINIDQWFDRNDLCHSLLLVGIFLYFFGVRGYYRALSRNI